MTIRSLAIETSSRVGSIALAEDGRTILEDTFPHGLQNAARIVPSIDALTRRLGWTRAIWPKSTSPPARAPSPACASELPSPKP